MKQPHILRGLTEARWDLVVIDEAHLVSGDSVRHEAAHLIAGRSRQVVLLTATPHSGDDVRFGRLANLGALPGVDDKIVTFGRTKAEIGLHSTRHVRWHAVTPTRDERQAFDCLTRFERAVLSGPKAETAPFLLSVLRKRALSTMAALVSSIERRLAWLTTASDPPCTQLPLFTEDDDDCTDEDAAALRSESGLPNASERELLSRALDTARRASVRSSKIERLTTLLRRTTEAVVVFTEFRDSLRALIPALSAGSTPAVLHGGTGEVERRRELARFSAGSARVLLATDVASQGLNLQHRARWIWCLELPWNPVRLEQRIGRVDRIGQIRPTHATLLVSRHPAEAAVLGNLAKRVRAARRAVGPAALSSVAHPSARAEPDAPRLLTPRSWRRPAAALTRSVSRRRALVGGSQFDLENRGRPLWTTGLGWETAERACVLVSVAFTNTTGTTLERHLLWLGVPRSMCAPRDPGFREALVDVASRELAPRARRLGRILKARLGRLKHIDDAIAIVASAASRNELQPGLFDPRWASTGLGGPAPRRAYRHESTDDRQPSIVVEIGRPVIEIVWMSVR